jgi:tRNA U34 5-carboxymethylaminomethyl modifying GTPase MnmE/TrmE
VLAAVQQNGEALEFASPELQANKDVVFAAVHNHERALEFASDKLKKDKKFLIKCYRKNKNKFIIINHNDFIKEFDKLEKQEYDNVIIKKNIDILHLVKNKEQLCEYLYQNIKYDIIYHNEKIAEYIKNKYKIIIFSCNDINIKKDHGNDELRENFIQKNPNYNVRFID